MDGIENRVENGAEASLLRLFGGAKERSEIAVLDRDQHRPRAGLLGDREIALGEAEEVIGAGGAAPTQLVGLGRIDADRQSPRLQFPHRLLEMGERGVGQATEIDHVGALGAQDLGARDNRLEADLRSIDDLGENPERMARQIERGAGLAEKRRQVLQLVGSALKRPAEFLRQAREVGAAAAGDDHAVGVERARQPAHQDWLGHQRRDFYAHVEDRPIERRRRHALQDLLEPALREAAGQKQNALRHAAISPRRRAIASRSSASVSTVVAPAKRPRRSRFSKSIGRG